MAGHDKDLRGCFSAYDCRERLPELAAWMSEDDLKQLPIWQGRWFDRGRIYFDLDNPERGEFVATGDERPPTDHTYVCRTDVPDSVWAKLITWRQPVSGAQGRALDMHVRDQGIGYDPSGAGQAKPRPPE